MADLEYNPLDPPRESMLHEYLAAELDPQHGRAEERFRQFLQEEPRDRGNRFMLAGRMRGWTFSIAGTAIAACLAVLWAGPALRLPHGAPTSHDNPTPGPALTQVNSNEMNLPWVDQNVATQYDDGGTYIDADGHPIRVMHRWQWEKTRFFDENKKLRAETVVPRDDLVYVQMKTY